VLHVDLDQFLAAVEIRRRPELRGRPVVVGGSGDPTERRKVVQTASYEARAYGVRSGMPLRTAARLCPDAVFLPSDPAAYEAASEEVMATLRIFGVEVEVWGWDEAFLGVRTDDPDRLAADVRRAVTERTGLSCSVGIGDTKLRAKLATGFAKPAGTYQLTRPNWVEVMADRPTEALWGIGRKTARRLGRLGVHTVADLAAADPAMLADRFGPTIGPWLRQLGRGLGGSAVSSAPRLPRSRSRETTYPHDLATRSDVDGRLTALARELAAEVAAGGRPVVRVAVKVRTASFYTRIKARTLPAPSIDGGEIVAAALEVLDRFELDRPVRLLGVRVDFAEQAPPAPPAQPDEPDQPDQADQPDQPSQSADSVEPAEPAQKAEPG